MNTRMDALKSRMILPAIAAPMFLVSNPETVIAACKSGVMGSFPGPNARTAEDLRDWLVQITTAVGPDDAPWAMNMGEYAMLPFIEEVRSFFDGPLIVGGGIGTGRAIRAVENLGVDFAYLGTRFLATAETMIPDAYRQMVWQSTMEDLIASRAITGALGNWMRASVEAAGIAIEDMKEAAKLDFSGDMHAGSKAWKHVWSAGQGVGAIKGPERIADVVATLVAEYNAAVDAQSRGSRFGTTATHKNGA